MTATVLERRPRRARRSRERACGGKVRFRDHEEAIDFLHGAGNARLRAAADGVATTHCAVRAYDCAQCHGVHVTSQSSWGAR